MRPPREWTRATRKPGAGMHIYIPKDEVERALQGAGLPPQETRLLVRSVSMITGRKRLAKVVIEVKLDTERILTEDKPWMNVNYQMSPEEENRILNKHP